MDEARKSDGRAHRALQRVERALNQPAAGWVLLTILALVYSIAYVKHPLFPGTGEGAAARGWWTWNDQQRYLNEARAIALGALDAGNYHYPVGYPALGSVSINWMPEHPFFLPDLVMIGLSGVMWWKIARRWLSAVGALLTAVVFVAIHRELIGITMVVPWNTIATQTTIWAGMFVVLAVQGRAAVVALAILGAITYVCRPVDAVTFAPLLLLATWRVAEWRARMGAALVGLVILAVAVGGVGLLNRHVFGQWRTPYEIVSSETIGFFGYPVSCKLYWLLVDGTSFFGEGEPALLFRYPWLFLALPAVIYLIRRERAAGLAIVASLALNLGLYLNYNDLLPSDIYRFTLIHYLTWSFPLFAVLGVAALRDGLRDRAVQVSVVAAAAMAVFAVGVQLQPRVVEAAPVTSKEFVLPTQRPLEIRFPGADMGLIGDLRLDQRTLVEYSQYLTPYVPSDLKLLVGKRAAGSRLTVVDGSKLNGIVPVISQYRWRWSPVWSRIVPSSAPRQ